MQIVWGFFFSKGNAKAMISREQRFPTKQKQPPSSLCLLPVPVCGQKQNLGVLGFVLKETFLFVRKVKQDRFFSSQ